MVDISSDSDTVELYIFDLGKRISFWESYTFTREFLSPSDAWSISTGDYSLISELRKELLLGMRVSLVINDKTQCTGYIDSLDYKCSADSGLKLEIKGRDTLAPMVDAGIDPHLNFSQGSTLNDIITKVASPFGFKIFSTTEIANRSVITGFLKDNIVGQKIQSSIDTASFDNNGKPVYGTQATTVTQQYDPTKPKFLKDFKLDNVKPRPGEGCFEFLAKLCKRFKLWLWAGALGDTLIIDEPDFTQKPIYDLFHSTSGSNILDSSLAFNVGDQPSCIVAFGTSSSAASFSKSSIRVAMVNELVGLDERGKIRPEVLAAIQTYKGARILDIRPSLLTFSKTYLQKTTRPVYLQDDESKTTGQLEGFVRNQMSKYQSKSFVLKYKVHGHTYQGKPWAINTMANVHDDFLDVHEPLWIREVTFTKSRQGTFTDLNLIRPYTLDLGG